MTAPFKQEERILVIDCCEHIVSALKRVLKTKLKSVASGGSIEDVIVNHEVELIVIGAPKIPVRRLFMSRLRRFYPEAPMLILRREKKDYSSNEEWLRGEFLLSDRPQQRDLEIVNAVRRILPLKPCIHLHAQVNYELVREVTRVLAENYTDANLNLEQVAEELSISPLKLSRILNKRVRISFRQMLRTIRIEEAKRLLASHKLSVKEVAARVGFSDSHYFSRIFKEMTGLNPTEYEYSSQELILN